MLIIVVLAELKRNQTTKVFVLQGLTTFGERQNALYAVPENSRASLGVQWLRIHLPMQGAWAPSLVWEDPMYLGAAKPVRHSC